MYNLLKHFSRALVEAFGVLWLIVEITDYFFANSQWSTYLKSSWWVFCVSGLIIGTVRARPRRSVEARIKDTDIVVEVRIGNIWTKKGAIIVGSNTTFDTNTTDGTISLDSVQGQFTQHYCRNTAELDALLAESLRPLTVAGSRSREDKPYGNVDEYEFGTVAPITAGGRKAYFVAIAQMNSDRVASSDADALQDALPRIWNGIRNRGGLENLLSPVLGSGYSRLSLTRQELVQAIIRSFVVASQEGKLTEKLTIVVHPKDFKQGQFDLDDLQRFLEHECVYGRLGQTPEEPPAGVPLP